MIVNPNTTAAMTASVVAAAQRVAQPGTVLLGATAGWGSHSIESHLDEVWGAAAVAELVEAAEAAESARIDAYVIACFGDTGLPAAQEIAAGPVVGMTEAALVTAALIAHRFTIVTMPRRTLEQSDRVVRSLGLGHRCAVRAVDVAVSQVHSGSGQLLELFIDEGRQAMARDDAEALILGCSGLADLVEPLQEALGIPVIEGVAAGVAMAQALLAQRLATSRANTRARPERRRPSPGRPS
jgi:allantoin racemase